MFFSEFLYHGEHVTRSDADGGRSSSFSSTRKKRPQEKPVERFSGGGRHLGIPQNRPTEGLTRHGSGRLLPKGMTLVVHRGSISQGRMTTMRVVPTFQPSKYGHARIDLAVKALPVDDLTLQRGEKRFRHRVIVGVSDPAHRGSDARLRAALAEGVAGVLGLTRFGGHLSVYREGVRNVEQGNEVSSGISQANGRIGLGRPQIRGPIQRVRPNGLDHPKMG